MTKQRSNACRDGVDLVNPLIGLLGKDGIKVADLERLYAANRDTPTLAANAISAMDQLDTP